FPGPPDMAVLHHHRGVAYQPERRPVTKLWIVGHQLPDAVHQDPRHCSCTTRRIERSRSRPTRGNATCSRSSTMCTPPLTTSVTSAPVAANTAVSTHDP